MLYQIAALDRQAGVLVLTESPLQGTTTLPTSSEALWLLGVRYQNQVADPPDAEGSRPLDQEVRTRWPSTNRFMPSLLVPGPSQGQDICNEVLAAIFHNKPPATSWSESVTRKIKFA